MSHLLQEHAPITQAGWELLGDEARERLTPALAARKLVEFAGPHGWEHSAANLGRVQPLADTPVDGLTASQRRVMAPPSERQAGLDLAPMLRVHLLGELYAEVDRTAVACPPAAVRGRTPETGS